jgi:chromosome segregation ATPase
MEECKQWLVQAMEDLENWAAGLRAHHDGIQWDIDMERLALSHERHEILSLQAQLSITPKDVAQLRASIAALETQAKAREEDARTQLTAASERLAASTTRVSALEGDLRAANSSLEASGARVATLEAALEST